MFLLPDFVQPQSVIKKEVDKYIVETANSLQELNLKLVDEYGLNNIQFLKLEDGKYIPMKPDESQNNNEVQISQDVIVIFAIIGAVLVGLMILRAIL